MINIDLSWIDGVIGFIIGMTVMVAVIIIGSLLTHGGRCDEIEQKLWRNIEADLDVIERREIRK